MGKVNDFFARDVLYQVGVCLLFVATILYITAFSTRYWAVGIFKLLTIEISSVNIGLFQYCNVMKVDLSQYPLLRDSDALKSGCHNHVFKTFTVGELLDKPFISGILGLLSIACALVGIIWANSKILPSPKQLRKFFLSNIIAGIEGLIAVIWFVFKSDDMLPEDNYGNKMYRNLELDYGWSFYLMIAGSILLIASAIFINMAPLSAAQPAPKAGSVKHVQPISKDTPVPPPPPHPAQPLA